MTARKLGIPSPAVTSLPSKIGTLANQPTSSQGLRVRRLPCAGGPDLQPLAKVVDEEVRNVDPV